jgi:hypothetical protein
MTAVSGPIPLPFQRQVVDVSKFNPDAAYPYELRQIDFQAAMQDVYDFFYDVNTYLVGRGLARFEDTLRSANLSGMLSDMLNVALAKHARSLTSNRHHNGHPDLVVEGVYPNDMVKAGEEGIEVKATVNQSGAVDTHGARNQTMCVFSYKVDRVSEPAIARSPLRFTAVFLNEVTIDLFRHNARKTEIGTRTSTLDRAGIARLRENWVYLDR